MISYAQNHEDVMLRRLFRDQQQGFYIDVGANHPIQNSVTNFFYQSGWAGINIEPNPSSFTLLSKHRKRDKNLSYAISDSDSEMVFYDFSLRGGSVFSTLSETEAKKRKESGMDCFERRVPVKTLSWICENHCHQKIDFITIDVEGHEHEAILGMDWSRWKPRVVVVEATLPTTTDMSHQSWEPILLQAGYVYACFDGLNRYYVRTEHDRLLLQVPVNVCDRYVSYEHQKRVETLEKELNFYKTTTLHALEPLWQLGSLVSSLHESGPREFYQKLGRRLERTKRSFLKPFMSSE